jgi:hypothetical protein
LNIRIEAAERRISDKRNGLETVYNESSSELQNLLLNFDETLQKKSNGIRTLQRSVGLLNDEISQFRLKCNEYSVQKGNADSARDQFEFEKGKLLDASFNAAKQCNVNPPGYTASSWSAVNAKSFVQNIQDKVSNYLPVILY